MLEWPRKMNGDPSKRSKHQILTLPPWTWTWHKGVLWFETTNRDPCRPREVAANWSNPARRKTNSPWKRHLFDDNHPTRETWWAEATSPLEYRMPEEYLLYLRLKKKANNQYHLAFYNISEVVPIIKVAKVTNNLRDNQLKKRRQTWKGGQ